MHAHACTRACKHLIFQIESYSRRFPFMLNCLRCWICDQLLPLAVFLECWNVAKPPRLSAYACEQIIRLWQQGKTVVFIMKELRKDRIFTMHCTVFVSGPREVDYKTKSDQGGLQSSQGDSGVPRQDARRP